MKQADGMVGTAAPEWMKDCAYNAKGVVAARTDGTCKSVFGFRA